MDKKARIALIALFLVAVLAVSIAVAKPRARAPKEECRDRIDNDGDGFKDLADSGCDNKWDNDESNCGDGVCEGGEVCDVCVADCGTCHYCGDGNCDADEDCNNCETDCGVCDSCSDTDGWDHYTKGTVSGYNSGSPYSYDDFCVDNLVVKEQYCSGTQPSNYDFYCPSLGNTTTYECVSGACVEQ